MILNMFECSKYKALYEKEIKKNLEEKERNARLMAQLLKTQIILDKVNELMEALESE